MRHYSIGPLRRIVRDLCFNPARREAIILWPVIAGLSYWAIGPLALAGAVVIWVVVMLVIQGTDRPGPGRQAALAKGAGQPDRLTQMLDSALRVARRTGQSTACLVLQMDDAARFGEMHGASALSNVLAKSAARFLGMLREGDMVAALPDSAFAIGLRPGRRLDLETLIQMSARVQSAISAGVTANAITHHITFSVGFCLAGRSPDPTAASLLNAARIAAFEAALHGPAAIRAFCPEMAARQGNRLALADDLARALENGEICAYFQPQISTDTGAISGFEALARWDHPERGTISPTEFLPMIDACGNSARLTEVILLSSLAALRHWDKMGINVPCVGINFSTHDLQNPKLVENLKWELDRYNLAPQRISIEILETVMADTDSDVCVRNITALAQLGCGIDLDDFGTGNASIAGVRRFDVRRIKIDRSFVTQVDHDRSQQRMISALVSLADQLGLDTLAEGVETAGEHAMLAQLGCRHVQGFHIARPMPFDATLPWIIAHQATRVAAPRIGNRALGGS